MDAVTLKGRQSGFELQLASEASLDEITAALTTLLARVAGDTKDQEHVDFVLETGDRLLNEDQAKAVQTVFDTYPQFAIKTIHAAVAAVEPLRAEFAAKATHLVGGVLRSGQEADYSGDVLFLGDLHRGATLKTTGSIFVMGQVEGLLIAGTLGDQEAVIVGDISRAAQIRIADTLEIIDKNSYTAQTTSYIDDLHALVHGKVPALAKLRPKLFRKLEEM